MGCRTPIQIVRQLYYPDWVGLWIYPRSIVTYPAGVGVRFRSILVKST